MSRALLPLCGLLLAACGAVDATSAAVPTQTLVPRQSDRGTATPMAPATIRPVQTAGPTPTPFSHRIVDGDTLLGIALQYGIELNDLLLANPGVNPRFLTVGTQLIVPLEEGRGPVPTATPRPVGLSPVRCYPAVSGELWCLVTASLADGPPAEGLVGLVTLVDSAGQPLRTEPAFSPLNLLRPGSQLPLVAYFAPPAAEFAAASVVLISAVSAGDPAERYLPVEIAEVESTVSADQRSGTVNGVILIEAPVELAPDWIRIVAMGVRADGSLVGLTTFEPDLATLEEGTLEFSLQVASFGPPIARIEVLAEVRAGGI